MISFCLEMNLQNCAIALHVVYHATRSTMMNGEMMHNLPSLVVHEEKIRNALHNDSGSKTARE